MNPAPMKQVHSIHLAGHHDDGEQDVGSAAAREQAHGVVRSRAKCHLVAALLQRWNDHGRFEGVVFDHENLERSLLWWGFFPLYDETGTSIATRSYEATDKGPYRKRTLVAVHRP